MSAELPRRRKRGTPISASLGADLQALGTILANHTRGLDDYLSRQARRIDERSQNLLAETPGLLLPPALDLDGMTTAELRDLCRRQRLRGWSKLRRAELLIFLREQVGPELQANSFPNTIPADAKRTERLLLLLLQHLGVPQEQVDAAWRGASGKGCPPAAPAPA